MNRYEAHMQVNVTDNEPHKTVLRKKENNSNWTVEQKKSRVCHILLIEYTLQLAGYLCWCTKYVDHVCMCHNAAIWSELSVEGGIQNNSKGCEKLITKLNERMEKKYCIFRQTETTRYIVTFEHIFHAMTIIFCVCLCVCVCVINCRERKCAGCKSNTYIKRTKVISSIIIIAIAIIIENKIKLFFSLTDKSH